MAYAFRRVLALVAGLAALLYLAVPAAAVDVDYVARAGQALRQERLYVDPDAGEVFTPAELATVRARVDGASTPVYLAVLPAAATSQLPSDDPGRMPYELYQAVGDRGTYAVLAGSQFRAGSNVIDGVRAGEIATQVTAQYGRPADGIVAFVDQVETAAAAGPRSDTDSGSRGTGTSVLPWLLLLLVAVAGAALVAQRRRRKQRARADAAELATVRGVVDEDITSFGEELERVNLTAASDATTRDSYRQALDAYERAKQLIDRARRPMDVQPVTHALEDGRYALACVQARQEGRPLPQRRPPCFFDPRHGPSVEDVSWAPDGGTPREVPVCAADATRIRDGLEPMARTVPVPGGRLPYWDAGPAYGPWASGWYGGYGTAFLPGLLVGTVLGGTMLGGWGPAGGWYEPGPGAAGDDWQDGGDFGGGGGDFGDGGGDFGDGGGGGDFG